LRSELYPKGLEVVTVSLELSGPEVSRPYIEAARPEHPSLLDPTHQMDALFGVVNIPNVVWIDEAGTIVRPAEPGWPGGRQELPPAMGTSMPKLGRARNAPPRPAGGSGQRALLASGQDRESYPEAIRNWVQHGAASPHALAPHEVVARSQPRPMTVSQAAAHFELANHLWRAGRRQRAIEHFRECHRLQPDNWTYKRQAWSLLGNERVGGAFGRFVQGPVEGEEDEWPFESDFRSDVAVLADGAYYPKTL
jgi:tetratricopeptide (TPR) repeat protein